MATYKVKPSDNYSKIAEQYQVPVSTLVKLNRQAPLSAGMTIKVPKVYSNATPPTFQYGLMNWGITQPQTQGSFVSGSGGVNLQKNDLGLSAFPRSQGPLANTSQPQTLAQGSFVSGSGGVNMAQSNMTMGGRGTMLPSAADFQTAGSMLGPQPTGTYTGGNSANDQAWRDLWNQQAANPPPPSGEFPGFWGGGKNGGFFKTLREARQATRRKRINEEEQDRGRPTYSPPVEVKPILGERQQTVTWNVGG